MSVQRLRIIILILIVLFVLLLIGMNVLIGHQHR